MSTRQALSRYLAFSAAPSSLVLCPAAAGCLSLPLVLHSVSSTWESTGVPPHAAWIVSARWRGSLCLFPIPQDHCLSLPNIQCLKNHCYTLHVTCYMHYSFFFFFGYFGSKSKSGVYYSINVFNVEFSHLSVSSQGVGSVSCLVTTDSSVPVSSALHKYLLNEWTNEINQFALGRKWNEIWSVLISVAFLFQERVCSLLL